VGTGVTSATQVWDHGPARYLTLGNTSDRNCRGYLCYASLGPRSGTLLNSNECVERGVVVSLMNSVAPMTQRVTPDSGTGFPDFGLNVRSCITPMNASEIRPITHSVISPETLLERACSPRKSGDTTLGSTRPTRLWGAPETRSLILMWQYFTSDLSLMFSFVASRQRRARNYLKLLGLAERNRLRSPPTLSTARASDRSGVCCSARNLSIDVTSAPARGYGWV
jgi:hypothetical protein